MSAPYSEVANELPTCSGEAGSFVLGAHLFVDRQGRLAVLCAMSDGIRTAVRVEPDWVVADEVMTPWQTLAEQSVTGDALKNHHPGSAPIAAFPAGAGALVVDRSLLTLADSGLQPRSSRGNSGTTFLLYRTLPSPCGFAVEGAGDRPTLVHVCDGQRSELAQRPAVLLGVWADPAPTLLWYDVASVWLSREERGVWTTTELAVGRWPMFSWRDDRLHIGVTNHGLWIWTQAARGWSKHRVHGGRAGLVQVVTTDSGVVLVEQGRTRGLIVDNRTRAWRVDLRGRTRKHQFSSTFGPHGRYEEPAPGLLDAIWTNNTGICVAMRNYPGGMFLHDEDRAHIYVRCEADPSIRR